MDDSDGELSEEQFPEKIEELIEKKVDERIKEKNYSKNNSERTDSTNKSENKDDSKEMTRRSFLKKTGLGALAIGALGITPASSMILRDPDGVDVQDGPLDMNGNDIINVGNIDDGGGSDGITREVANLYVGGPPPQDAENGDVWISNDNYSFRDYLPVWENQIDSVDGVTAGPNYIYAATSRNANNELLKLDKSSGNIVESNSISGSTGELLFENNKLYIVGNPSTVYDTSLTKLGEQNWGYGRPSPNGNFYAVSATDVDNASSFTVREYSGNLNDLKNTFTITTNDDSIEDREFKVGNEYLVIGGKDNFADGSLYIVDFSSESKSLIVDESQDPAPVPRFIGDNIILIESQFSSFDGSSRLEAFDFQGNELWTIEAPAGRSSNFRQGFISDDRRFMYAVFSGRVFAYTFGNSPPQDLSTASKPSPIWQGLSYRDSVSGFDGKDLISRHVKRIAGGYQEEYASLGNTGIGETKALKEDNWQSYN